MKETITYLKQDPIRHLNLLGFMKENKVHSLRRVGNSVILRGRSNRDWTFISSPNEDELNACLPYLTEEDRSYAVIEDWMLPIITAGRSPEWMLSTVRLFLPEEVHLQYVPRPAVRPLTVRDVPYLYKYSDYRDFISPEYIRMRIEQGPSAGITVGWDLAGWVMTHDDGAIGFLHVLEKYRRRGYAKELMKHIIQQVRSRGKTPYIHIEETNTGSMSLALNLGFRRDRLVHWFGLES